MSSENNGFQKSFIDAGMRPAETPPMPDLALPPAAPLAVPNPQPPTLITQQRLDEQPAAVYLAQLTTRSRRTMTSALDQLAALLGYPDALACPWSRLPY